MKTSLTPEKSFLRFTKPRRNDSMPEIEPIQWEDGHLRLLDQRVLPQRQEWLEVRSYRQAIEADPEER